MPDSTQDIILDELGALRGDFSTLVRDTGERVSVMETDVHSLVANGRPGRVDRLESSVLRLKQWRWWRAEAASSPCWHGQ